MNLCCLRYERFGHEQCRVPTPTATIPSGKGETHEKRGRLRVDLGVVVVSLFARSLVARRACRPHATSTQRARCLLRCSLCVARAYGGAAAVRTSFLRPTLTVGNGERRRHRRVVVVVVAVVPRASFVSLSSSLTLTEHHEHNNNNNNNHHHHCVYRAGAVLVGRDDDERRRATDDDEAQVLVDRGRSASFSRLRRPSALLMWSAATAIRCG